MVIPARAGQVAAVLLVCAAAFAQSRSGVDLRRFDGKAIAISRPETDADGFFPKGPATVCLEGPQRQCYTAPKDFGRNPDVTIVQLKSDVAALLFSAESGGVSGWMVHFALLRPGRGKNLQNLFVSDVSVSNQSQNAFWSDPGISDAQFFIIADYVWGPEEGHYGPHRYIISAYVQTSSLESGDCRYHLEDCYMTARRYDPETGADILASERPELLSRLRRLKRADDSLHVPR